MGKDLGPPSEQLRFLVANPLAVIAIADATLSAYGTNYLRQMIGVLGWNDTAISEAAWMSLLAMTAAIFLLDRQDRRWGLEYSVLVGGIVSTIGAVFLSLCVVFNELGSLQPIDGVQGRYFLPVLPFLAFLVPLWLRQREWQTACAVVIALVAVLLSHYETVRTVTERYYL